MALQVDVQKARDVLMVYVSAIVESTLRAPLEHLTIILLGGHSSSSGRALDWRSRGPGYDSRRSIRKSGLARLSLCERDKLLSITLATGRCLYTVTGCGTGKVSPNLTCVAAQLSKNPGH